MRRLLGWVGIVLGVCVLGLATAGWATFGGLASQPETEDLPGLGHALLDTYVGIDVVELGDGHLLLVDAGFDATGAPLLAALAAHGQTPDQVVAILLTHGHPDHTAGTALFPDARVYGGAPEAPYAAGERAYLGPIPRLSGPVSPGVTITDPVADGDVLHLGSRRIEAFLVPGHTAGSVAWLVDDTLFIGDSGSLTKEGRLIAAPWVFSDDQDQNAASLVALAQRLKPRAASIHRLVTSHTGSVEGIGALLALAP